ncbi:MAG: cell envelope integrity protein TolA [Methylococcaceae bacterium]|nr:cell envelope integrity protein TolA [Methylococcaceae bacterium]
MSTTKKLSLPFIFAITLHLAIAAMFGYSFFIKDKVVEIKPTPEIIEATVLDEETIMAESKRLKTNEENKKIAQKKKQQEIEDKRKKEEVLFQDAKEKRENEEKKAQELEKQRHENELKEKKLEKQRKERAKEEKVKKEKAEEAARLAKIKKQKEEKKRQDDLRKAEEKKRVAAQKAKKEKAEKQKAQKAEREAEWARELAAEQAEQETISIRDAISKKIYKRWTKPPSARKGMSCEVSGKLLPSGEVEVISVTRSSGNILFDNSAENAIRKASPLPVPKDRSIFIKEFRDFSFEFEPE